MEMTENFARRLADVLIDCHKGGQVAIFNYDGDLLATGELPNPPYTELSPGRIKLNQPHSIELFQRAPNRMRPFMCSTFRKDGTRILHCTAGYKSDFLPPETLVEDLETMKLSMVFSIHKKIVPNGDDAA